ncbi:MAG TPA: alpha/beta fold hydrolase [Candidatus Dormibacteraeota bacterium]|nr:alpha/beta fold hydrolase [Candidatus Dormibacteraeota bacterium]
MNDLSSPPPAPSGSVLRPSASIVFVHGAGHAAWCWHENFTGWFAARGYSVSAPDLPLHGEVQRGGINRLRLADYVGALAAEVARRPRPVVLVGHSMGGFIIQRHLEDAQVELAILLASVPPRGAGGMVRRMATRRPLTFIHTMLTSRATGSARRTRDYFFSPTTPDDVVERCHSRLQRESTTVLRDMLRGLHPERVRTPVVVMGAEHDWLVAPLADLAATATAFGTRPITLPGGHDMMLDHAWELVARAVDDAIVSHVSPRVRRHQSDQLPAIAGHRHEH